MYIKSDRWGTINWGLLSQATDNVALLPDLSGTIIESNAVFFEGPGFFLRPKGAKPSALGQPPGIWGKFLFCDRQRRHRSGLQRRTLQCGSLRFSDFGGFSASGAFGEDDNKDVALKYAADWNNFKVSAAIGFSQTTDENVHLGGGGGLAGFDQVVDLTQGGVSVMHVPSGLSSGMARPRMRASGAVSFRGWANRSA